MQIEWLPKAVQNLIEIRSFIAADRPGAAAQTARLIINTISCLRAHPEIGRAGRIPGTRELVIPGKPYIVLYRVKNDVVVILRVFHTSRKPESMDLN